MRSLTAILTTLAAVLFLGAPAPADYFSFSTGDPDGRMATASRPESYGKIEIESADDFILDSETFLYGATFTGLLPYGATIDDIGEVRVEIYRVFPHDSDFQRIPRVPTRVNSPADVEFPDQDRSNADGNLSFTIAYLQAQYQAANSVIDGIYPSPDQTTGGDGPVDGQLVQFQVSFDEPIDLPADHYFFVPQVEVVGDGNFLWLSAPHPQFDGDLQMWIRNAKLDPDWLRVGADIVSGTTFNGSFSLFGETAGY